ncbi:ORF6N domain-containing protein [uncultured Clostridium sp.]|uniref:ORF6N domain-containing protein n=1 Tax=uncultured Clostridium sp. TaxID=59620 RepID=UPI0028F02681|nr:ORF6N domain-containing protein [uncultured Clostridium sp.]
MNELMPLEFKNQRIMLTKTLADQYGTEDVRVHQNYLRNKDRFVEGKHFYKLEGEELKRFKTDYLKDSSLKINSLILWTDRGAARHAKILDTDEAWEVYEALEENYFNPKQSLNTSELSPELQMFKQIFDTVAKQQLENKQIKAEIKETKEEIQGIRDIVTLNPNSWRTEVTTILNKIAIDRGGTQEAYRNIRNESYELLDARAGSKLSIRLTNMRRKILEETGSKSKADKVSKLDVIASDKRLTEVYLAIVKDMAIRYGV